MANFLFGISTAGHHIEGNDVHSDWWQHEQELTGGVASGEACDSYRKFKRDRKLLQSLRCNAYRFSLEWSRIEPQKGAFDRAAIKHYQDLIKDLQEHGIEPVVTLHHFTNPEWFAKEGGWADSNAADKFLRYVKHILPILKSVTYFTPINEPNLYVSNKYLSGVWFPYLSNPLVAWRALTHLLDAHRRVRALLKANISDARVGSCVHLVDLKPLDNFWWPLNAVAAGLGSLFMNHLSYFFLNGEYDFVGLNFYSTYRIGIKGIFPQPTIEPHPLTGGQLTMVSEPKRLLFALRAVGRYGKPIFITENGKLTNNDRERIDYLMAIQTVLRQALGEGIDLRGYLHFTHLDSFEWGLAFAPRFGLFAYDRKKRHVSPKPSARIFCQLASNWVKLVV